MPLVATFRHFYHVSAWDIGLGRSVSWAEACDLVDAALDETSTPLFVAVAGWKWPATMPELMITTGLFGKSAAEALPLPTANDGRQVSAAEEQRAHEELLEEIKFKR